MDIVIDCGCTNHIIPEEFTLKRRGSSERGSLPDSRDLLFNLVTTENSRTRKGGGRVGGFAVLSFPEWYVTKNT